MNITHIVPFFPGKEFVSGKQGNIGGVERCAWSLVKFLRKNHNITVLTTKYKVNEELDGIKVIRFKPINLFRAPLFPKFYFKIPKETDIIHAHATYPFLSDIASLKKKPAVLTYHFDGYSNSLLGRLATKFYYLTFAKLMDYNKILFTSNSYYKTSRFFKSINSDKIKIIPNGVDTEFFTPDRTDSNRILFVGRLVDYKGIKYFLEAAEKTNYIYDVVGNGPLLTSLRKKAPSNVYFHGNVPDTILREFYRNCGLFVLPSINRQEAFGISLIEAMACGRTVIASNLDGVKEVVGNPELLFKPKDAISLKEKIIELMEDKKRRRKLGKQFRKKAEKYSWKGIANKIENIYQSIK